MFMAVENPPAFGPLGVLENVIGRSPKAWGLGQKAKICFPPARGAYFSIKCGQNTRMDFVPKGSGLSVFLGFYRKISTPCRREANFDVLA